MIKTSSPKKYSYAIIILSVLLMTWMTYQAIWIGDDIKYGFYCFGYAGQRLNSVFDIFGSQWNHWNHQNGRYVAHWLVQFFIAFGGRTLFSIFNGMMYAALSILIMKLGKISIKSNPTILLIVFTFIMISLRLVFSPAYQIGYIWMSVFSLLFLYLFFKSTKHNHFIATLFIILFSFIAGWGQEAICTGIAASVCIYAFKNRKTLNHLQWIMITMYCLGTIMLCIAPGNLHRFNLNHDDTIIHSTLMSLFTTVYSLRITYILIILLIVERKSTSLYVIYKNNEFYFNTIFFLILFNIFIHINCNRQLFGIEIMSLIICVRESRKYIENKKILNIIACMAFIYSSFIILSDVSRMAHMNNVYAIIEKKYHESKDGTIYYDISNSDFAVDDKSPTAGFDDYSIETMNLLFKSKENKNKVLKVIPECLERYINKSMKSQTMITSKGTILLIDSKIHPAKLFELKKSTNISGFNIPQGKVIINPKHNESFFKFNINEKYFNVAIVREGTPFTRYNEAKVYD